MDESTICCFRFLARYNETALGMSERASGVLRSALMRLVPGRLLGYWLLSSSSVFAIASVSYCTDVFTRMKTDGPMNFHSKTQLPSVMLI